ncbi:MAG TPA: DegT/DnrJ/EryC1/StrS family aminotransferase [Solirubrobacterales bacterium]|jgi:dTDP-4-amino-4,6-dideoxygalactose transaminase|nr:DegT/DnrJ/EryC1/StrS family aminotransferase [Solirubrobacterales bacterium]
MSESQEPRPIPVFDVRLDEDVVAAVADTLRSGWLTMGPRIQAFEAEFAEHLGVTHAVATSSCTSALHLAYLAAGIGPGDEVIVPGITFVASAAAVRYCDATPVLGEIRGQHDLGLDPEDVAARITPRTKAVCAVHYGGYAAPLTELRQLCEERGLTLIEDAAHCPEAVLAGGEPGRKLGTYGQSGCFSFFSNKILSCGEGGLLATDDDGVAELARSRRSHAMTSGTWDRHRGHAMTYDVVEVGYNYRMDEPRAALLSARLPKLAADIARRRELTARYRELLADLDGVTLPYTDAEVEASSCYVMPVMVDPELRDEVRSILSERHKVQTSVLYPSINQFTAYGAGAESLPRCELAARTQVTLPLFPHLEEESLERVVSSLTKALAEAG